MEAVRDALRLYAEFSAAAPDALGTDAALITMPDGSHGFAISAFYAGPMDEVNAFCGRCAKRSRRSRIA